MPDAFGVHTSTHVLPAPVRKQEGVDYWYAVSRVLGLLLSTAFFGPRGSAPRAPCGGRSGNPPAPVALAVPTPGHHFASVAATGGAAVPGAPFSMSRVTGPVSPGKWPTRYAFLTEPEALISVQ